MRNQEIAGYRAIAVRLAVKNDFRGIRQIEKVLLLARMDGLNPFLRELRSSRTIKNNANQEKKTGKDRRRWEKRCVCRKIKGR